METSRIPASSRRQAMDWSLVLLSQHIESTIEFSDSAGWELLVEPADHPKAVTVLNQYVRENQPLPWQQDVSGVLFDWASFAWVVLVAFYFWLVPSFRLPALSMASAAFSNGEWWRIFTAIWLHADLGHLATNAVFGFLLLGLAMGHFGTGIGALGAYLAGVGGNLATGLTASGKSTSLGASGMVMGALGLLAVHSFTIWRRNRSLKQALSTIAGVIMLFALLGLSPGTDVMAHFGGFAAGIAIGWLLSWVGFDAQKRTANLLAGLLLAALIVVPWWFAFRR